MTKRKLAVFEEHPEAAAELAINLRALGYDVEVLKSEGALEYILSESPDLLVYVLSGPEGSGFHVLSELRNLSYYPPLAAMVAEASPARVAMLLECGCDCVITGTGDMLRVKAWFESLLRRRDMYQKLQEEQDATIRLGDIEIDVPARMVRTRTERSELTEREMKLLLELAQKPGAVCRRADLLASVWGSSAESLTGTLNTYINRLRMKIEDEFRIPKYLIGVYGVGYRLMTGAEPVSSSPVTAFPEKTEVAEKEAAHLPARKRSRIPSAS